MLNELMNKARLEFEATEWELDSEHNYLLKVFEGEILFKHRYIVEMALGKPLPDGAIVHHYNGNGCDNRWFNLVACQDENYHKLLHERAKIVFETNNPYAAIKKASFEWRESYNRKPRPYKTVAQLKVIARLNYLEKQDWWKQKWQQKPLGTRMPLDP